MAKCGVFVFSPEGKRKQKFATKPTTTSEEEQKMTDRHKVRRDRMIAVAIALALIILLMLVLGFNKKGRQHPPLRNESVASQPVSVDYKIASIINNVHDPAQATKFSHRELHDDGGFDVSFVEESRHYHIHFGGKDDSVITFVVEDSQRAVTMTDLGLDGDINFGSVESTGTMESWEKFDDGTLKSGQTIHPELKNQWQHKLDETVTKVTEYLAKPANRVDPKVKEFPRDVKRTA